VKPNANKDPVLVIPNAKSDLVLVTDAETGQVLVMLNVETGQILVTDAETGQVLVTDAETGQVLVMLNTNKARTRNTKRNIENLPIRPTPLPQTETVARTWLQMEEAREGVKLHMEEPREGVTKIVAETEMRRRIML